MLAGAGVARDQGDRGPTHAAFTPLGAHDHLVIDELLLDDAQQGEWRRR